jgi:REP element-mobilizing transposase RayT
VQTQLEFKTRGGKRKGAGRPPKGPRSSEPHKKRPSLLASEPLHVNVRVDPAISCLRKRHMYKAIREATVCVAKYEDFHIVHLSIQSNHLHLIVEAENKTALAKGMQGSHRSAARITTQGRARRSFRTNERVVHRPHRFRSTVRRCRPSRDDS